MIFCQQWMEVKTYANENDVSIMGDVPIYVSRDSAEVWSTPSLFKLDKEKEALEAFREAFLHDKNDFKSKDYYYLVKQRIEEKEWKERQDSLYQVEKKRQQEYLRNLQEMNSKDETPKVEN